jgi:hypothetical protein
MVWENQGHNHQVKGISLHFVFVPEAEAGGLQYSIKSLIRMYHKVLGPLNQDTSGLEDPAS